MDRYERIARWLLLAGGILLAHPVAGAAPPRPAPKPAKPLVRAVDGPGLKRAIAENRGKVVLVNFWATWCQPCVEEFPDLVKLYRAYQTQGLVVLAVSVDELETQSKVPSFLTAQKATFPAYVRKPGDSEAFINAVDKNWSGAVPVTYLYDRSGKPAGKPLVGKQSYTAFQAAVEPLLKQVHADRR
jgi:thiol-disulfide isomerase/thioredoxin